ncbi:MAG: potassium-transporting ATPase subunit KdpA [Acidimicrobiales bacterium]|jgi:K+-transporting ATPase ATPase A chain|nr:potassium-transporting ATPase subunit KdpA [Acidimicrobiales bacterium]
MSPSALFQLVLFLAVLAVTVPPLSRYLARVFGDPEHHGVPQATPGDRLFLPVERLIYRVCRIDPRSEQRWTTYALSLLAFSALSVLALYALLRFQAWLPLNPDGQEAVSPGVAFNTAISFVTNTNWQAYGGETTMSHLSQMLGLTVQNFVSAAAGMAVIVAVIRGLTRRGSATLGNFWVDLTRVVVRILVPLSLLVAVVLVSQGVIQNFSGTTEVIAVAGGAQELPGGPAASQVAIKQLGTNGGGFFNVNSAHPFENPNAWSNLVQTWAIVALPLAIPLAYGRMAKDRRQGSVLLAVMVVLWLGSVLVATAAETSGNPLLADVGADQSVVATQPGGNMEGKDVRFGPATCALWAGSTTGTSNGSVNCMHDSMTPAGGGVAMVNMLLGEVSPGGVGVGLMGLLVYALLAVFIAGLMVGRTPEYLGKKVQATEMKLVVLFIAVMPLTVLTLSAISIRLGTVLDTSIQDPGPHGLSEVLYAFASQGNNNGSAFAGFTADTPWMTTSGGIALLAGRFALIIPALAIAGSLARKQRVPVTVGTFPTDGPIFAGLVTGVVLIVAGLTFFPALALGPVVEQLMMS